MRTRTTLSLLSLLAVTALAGCGSSEDDDATTMLSRADLKSSLISLDDVGSAFKVDESDDDDDSDQELGCLDGLDELGGDSNDPERDEEISFEAKAEPELPGVFNTVGAFKSDADAAKVLTDLGKAVSSCKSVDVTDEDGARIQLAVSSDTRETDADATGQMNLEAAGSITVQTLTIPFSLRFSAIQLGNHVTVVGFVTMAEEVGPEADALAQRAFDRLSPILDGKDVPDLEPLDLKAVDLDALMSAGA
ncbi:hypothetical protein [Nocardioides marmoriginsengisoli]|nr:hypothetical protein [Nocardioides marmoriginsengisoli]